ncbi:cyclic peptide export ABC transporter [Vibrio europaeus]|uniref:cyclic peptide export ABC transporter n=1 Tax=Vibrio europaeus TaxID=300876 RepID=UPI00233ED375|nr:cyclic peptide export ABC transporter [Vibrio europaeus]MDC5822325.1 cyclic peptide export ABC transporter [Vibrio europaeus]
MRLHRLSDLFYQVSPWLFFVSLMTSVFTGLAYALLIPFIMYALSADFGADVSLEVTNYSYFHSPTQELAVYYLLLCGFIILIRTISQSLSTYIGFRATYQYRLSLYQQIKSMRQMELDRVGPSRIINLLSHDIKVIADASVNLPLIWINAIIIVGVMLFLLYLHPDIFFFVLTALAIAIVSYQIPMLVASHFMRREREAYDTIQEGVKGLIYGAKELRLNKQRCDNYYRAALAEPEKVALANGLKGLVTIILGGSYGQMLSFLIIGLVVFHLSYTNLLSLKELFSIVAALLYLSGPIRTILSTTGSIKQGKVSLQKIEAFYAELATPEETGTGHLDPNWHQLQVRDVAFRYPGNDKFGIRDINLCFSRGEVSFIVGGNGSGKTTLCKCLSTHFSPEQGQILLGNQIISSDNLPSVREQISVIYADFYLFSNLYFPIEADQDATIQHYLRLLELNEKVSLTQGEFSTLSLSAGQRRRVALLVTLLEDRPIIVFDEWAADQDPRFKEIFYRKILPMLREQNKIIIVISHDDRYFDVADNLVFMENGTVQRIEKGPATECELVRLPG